MIFDLDVNGNIFRINRNNGKTIIKDALGVSKQYDRNSDGDDINEFIKNYCKKRCKALKADENAKKFLKKFIECVKKDSKDFQSDVTSFLENYNISLEDLFIKDIYTTLSKLIENSLDDATKNLFLTKLEALVKNKENSSIENPFSILKHFNDASSEKIIKMTHVEFDDAKIENEIPHEEDSKVEEKRSAKNAYKNPNDTKNESNRNVDVKASFLKIVQRTKNICAF